MKVTALGLDLAKTVFHLVGLDEKSHEVMKKKIGRKDLSATVQNIPPCRIAMEACGSASFWGRKFQAMDCPKDFPRCSKRLSTCCLPSS